MHAAILYELVGDPDVDAIESDLDGTFPAIDASGTQYLDGKTLYHGRAAARIETEERVPVVESDRISKETDEQERAVSTDYFVDLESGWAGIDSSDGEFFVHQMLLGIAGVIGESRDINLAAWAQHFLDKPGASVWGINYGETNESGDSIRAGSAFNLDADISDVRKHRDELSGIGFRYDWDGTDAHGSIFESGYVAIFRDWTPDQFGRWVADEVSPYLVVNADGLTQDTIDETADGEEGQA